MSHKDFPPRRKGLIYLTEGGAETEVMYKMGYPLPEFAMFPLLDNEDAHRDITAMYRRYFEVAAKRKTGMLICAHDYRASPDWATKLGYSPEQLTDFQHRVIGFMDDLRREYADRVSDVYLSAAIGPRGDAYGTGGEITEAEARDYHAVQIGNLKGTAADMVTAVTFTNIAESIGVIRAAGDVGYPIGVSFNLGPDGKLRSGPTLKEAIDTVDAATDGAAAWFGTNCAHPEEFAPALADDGAWRKRLRYLRPNAAKMDKLALCKLGHLEDGDPHALGLEMADAVSGFEGLDIVGGCCGTDERHMDEIAARVQALSARG